MLCQSVGASEVHKFLFIHVMYWWMSGVRNDRSPKMASIIITTFTIVNINFHDQQLRKQLMAHTPECADTIKILSHADGVRTTRILEIMERP